MLKFPEIRDIAPPVEPPAPVMLPWMWWVAAGVFAVLILIGVFLWMRSVSRRVSLPGLPPPPDKLAAQALEALRQVAPSLSADDFAARLSEIVRTFLHRQTGVLARFATSPEILGDRSRTDQPPPPPAIAFFRGVLTASDALKFGPGSADRTVQTNALIDSALTAVELTAAAPPPSAVPPLPARPPSYSSATPPPLPPPLPASQTHIGE